MANSVQPRSWSSGISRRRRSAVSGWTASEIERRLEVQARLLIGEARPRMGRRLAVVADRALDVAAALEVRRELARDLRRASAVRGLQALADRLVQAPAGRRRDPLVDDLLVERVTEGVARARRAVGPRALARCAQDLLAADEPVAELLDVLDVAEVALLRRDPGDRMRRELRPDDARRLEHAEPRPA